MKTNIRFSSYVAQFFLKREMLLTTVVDKINTHILCWIDLFFFSNIMPFMRWCGKIFRAVPGACALHAVYLSLQTHWENIIFTAFFSLQQWLHERASMLRYTYNACLVAVGFHVPRVDKHYTDSPATYITIWSTCSELYAAHRHTKRSDWKVIRVDR
jgi:hypothetical protein